MKPVILLCGLLAMLLILVGPCITHAAPMSCLKKYEKVSKLTKICVYDCLGSEHAVTIKNFQICPLILERKCSR